MKKRLVIYGLVMLVMSTMVKAQEYKLAKSTGRLEIKEVNDVTIEGYNGNEIVFTSLDHSKDEDKRAKGLRAISNLGLEDNTGIGLSVQEKGDVYEVYQLKKMDGPEVKIMVPKGVTVSYMHTSPYGDDVRFKNVESELEVSTVHSDVELDNVTGPMAIRTTHGNIDASFSAAVKSPVSIVSTHGHVDVALPLTIKANLKLGTVYGDIFVDPDFKIEIDKTGSMVKYSDKLTGKVNGGGVDISLSSTHDSVYLRKK